MIAATQQIAAGHDLRRFGKTRRYRNISGYAEVTDTPFDLSGLSSARRSFACRPTGGALIVAVHHIATDGWSMDVFRQELGCSTRPRLPDATRIFPNCPSSADYAVCSASGSEGEKAALEIVQCRKRLADCRGRSAPPRTGSVRSVFAAGCHTVISLPRIAGGQLVEFSRRPRSRRSRRCSPASMRCSPRL